MKKVKELSKEKALCMHIQEFLKNAGANYAFNEEEHFFSFTMEISGLEINAYIIYNEEQSWIRCRMSPTIRVPEKKMEAVLWKLNDFNYKYSGVCLSMDKSDGEIVTSMTANTDGDAINVKIIGAMVFSCYNALEICIPDIMCIIYQRSEETLLQVVNSCIGVSEVN